MQEIREELTHGHETLNGASPPPDIWWLDGESDLTDSRQEQLQKELKEMKERLHLLKDGMMGKLILDARTTIRLLWDETSTRPAQQRAFQAFFVDLLLQHEESIHELESRLEKILPVLKLIAKRDEIILERMQYDRFQKDPERLQKK